MTTVLLGIRLKKNVKEQFEGFKPFLIMLTNMITKAVDDLLVCPECKTSFQIDDDKLVCGSCARDFMATPQGTLFLLEGPLPTDSALTIIEPLHEKRNLRYRVHEFHLPLLGKMSKKPGKEADEIRVLDNGCGIGGAVQDLYSAGYDCWGIDLDARHELPSIRDVRRYCREIDPALNIEPISPKQHLAFERITAFWYGKVFKGAMFAMISLYGCSWFRKTQEQSDKPVSCMHHQPASVEARRPA